MALEFRGSHSTSQKVRVTACERAVTPIVNRNRHRCRYTSAKSGRSFFRPIECHMTHDTRSRHPRSSARQRAEASTLRHLRGKTTDGLDVMVGCSLRPSHIPSESSRLSLSGDRLPCLLGSSTLLSTDLEQRDASLCAS